MNQLQTELADLCRQQRLEEKWLVAPSRRVGYQWLDAVARGGQSVVNVRIKTLRSMAVDLAALSMAERELTLVSPLGGAFLMDRTLTRLHPDALQYLTVTTDNRGLGETVLASLEALRLAGLDVGQLDGSNLEVPLKVSDLRTIAADYLAGLASEQLIDYPGALRLAIDRLASNPGSLGEGIVVIFPNDLHLHGLERQFVEAIPSVQRCPLATDGVATAATEKSAATDLERLRWLPAPDAAPQRLDDGTAVIVQAVGAVNEVRSVLRTCLAQQIALDDVEVLHTDADTYVPLIHECMCAIDRQDSDNDDVIPITFAEGIPVRYSRPGRALAGWLAWIRDDFPQAALVKSIREGLLVLPAQDDEQPSFNRLAALFRGIGIGKGRERYTDKIDEQLRGLAQQRAKSSETGEESEDEIARRSARLQRALDDVKQLRSLVSSLLEAAPAADATPDKVAAGALHFIERLARRDNKLDRFAAVQLQEEIQALTDWSAAAKGNIGFDIWQWLIDLPARTRVMGSGPRPGRLHVDKVGSGGHSGRRHTFILGLDDSRFPGAGLQDPLLLDGERRMLSPEMPTASARIDETVEDFARLLARLRGHLTLSYSSHNVIDDRELFPSSAVLAAFRVLSGNPVADLDDLSGALDQPVSFAPVTAERSLDSAEWWLWRLCGPQTVEQPRELVHRAFPHFAQGFIAATQRQSDRFTPYDGRVPAAGTHLDPTLEDGRVVSASGLQTFGKCPLRFFYQYGLQIELPAEVTVDPTRWLDPLASGSLLHELFEQFMRELVARDELPDFDRDHHRLEKLLDDKIAQYRDLYPPSSESIFRTQAADLRLAAATFLREEERFCHQTNSRPLYLEASLGLLSAGHPTPLDTSDPVPITLPNGKRIRTRGRIDRIDQIGSGALNTYAIWDYKSGSTYGYDHGQPFWQGRLMQPLLYVSIVTHRLRESVSKAASVAHFGFFFPGARAAGHRVSWTTDELSAGMGVLERLCQAIGDGAFLATNDHETDCTYCDYQPICGDVEAVAADSRRKLENHHNHLLKPVRELRSDG